MGHWHDLHEAFPPTLREPRAVSLRGGPSDLAMATLASAVRHGFAWSPGQFASGEHRLPLTVRLSSWVHGQPRGADAPLPAWWCEPSPEQGRFGPDRIERTWRWGPAGLELAEELLRTPDGRWRWTMRLRREAYRCFAPGWRRDPVALPWRLHLLVEATAPAALEAAGDGGLHLRPERGPALALAWSAVNARWGAPRAQGEHDLEGQRIDPDGRPEPVPPLPPRAARLVIPVDLRLLPGDEAELALGVAVDGPAADLVRPGAGDALRTTVAADWDGWLADRPCPDLDRPLPDPAQQLAGRASHRAPPTWRDLDGRDRAQVVPEPTPLAPLAPGDVQRAWRKCLALTRLCERDDPVWGPCLSETFTCYYSGTFGWSLPVVAWYGDRHADRPGLGRAVMDAYRAMQAADGGMPCYVAFRHPRPPAAPQRHPHTQQPQIAWTVWQEHLRHPDPAWLAGWAGPLLRFRDHLDGPARDPLGLGLWGQLHHYDGLDVFPTVDGLALRGDPVLYSAAFAAEQVQYQRALARILAVTGHPRAAEVADAADAAHRRLVDRLWDRERQWFGDILADGRRETVVGMQGLFALAYGLAPADADPVRLRANLEALIAPYGVCTVAPEDPRYCERFFWRGPVWPASCLYGMAAARRHAPDLLPRMAAACVRFALAQPNIWECLEPHSGRPALYDEGHGVMPGTSSVVGSYAICAALAIAAGGGDPFSLG